MKCSKCDLEAVYDSPALLCEEHWVKWWTGNDPNDSLGMTPKEAEAYYQEVMEWRRQVS